MRKSRKLINQIFNSKALFIFVLISLVAATVYLTVRLITKTETRDDYPMSLIQSLLGIFLLFLPSIAARRFKATLSSWMLIVYVVFIYCAIYLGEVHNFYHRVPHWDTLLHFTSGILLGILGYTLISFLNNSRDIPVALSPIFAALFIFSFSMALAVIWEIYEFSVDAIFGLNTQSWALEDGTVLIGRAALQDTMKDLIAATIGSTIFSIIGYFAIKRKSSWLKTLSLKRL
ncbi:hypothetical protein FWG86_01880 [Candidatus Saccharibacteria bacterium]|nr:hypothetical protein [Candidatus Saccharibacteria bacterium]